MKVSLAKLAATVKGRILGDEETLITGVNALDRACPGDIAFLSDMRHKDRLQGTNASAVILSEKAENFEGAQLLVDNPSLAYAKVAGVFSAPLPRYPGISERAVVHESTHIGRNVSIYPFAHVGEDVVIGDDTVIFPGVFIGDRVEIGSRTVLHANVSVLHDCKIGNDVIIHAGTVIGADGFGFAREGSRHVRIPQMGIVQIDDRVELGANNCVDRATFGETRIKAGVKTDNFVHVGHNVMIGEDALLVAQVGIAGSVKIGREVIVGPQAGFRDHVEVGDRSMIGPRCVVVKSVPPGQVVSGYPAIPHRLWLKVSKLIPRLPEFNQRIRRLEKRMKELKIGTEKE